MSCDRKKNEAVDLDTAITLAGLGKFHIGLVMVGGGCIAAATADSVGSGLVLPSVTCELNLTATEKGLYSGATFLGMVLSTCAWGSASDTLGRRGVLLLSSGLAWLTSFCASLAPVFWLLVALRFLTGIVAAAVSATIYAYMSEFFSPKDRTKYLSWGGIYLGVVFCLMPVAAWLILPLTWSLNLGFVVVRPWRIVSIFNGAFYILTFFGLLKLPESPKYLVSIDKRDEAIEVLRKIFCINTGCPAHEYPVHVIGKTADDIRTVGIEAREKPTLLSIFKTVKDQLVLLFGRNHIFTTILACAIQFFIFANGSGYYLWMPDILNHVMTYDLASRNATGTICDALSIRLPSTASNDTCHDEKNPAVFVGSLATGMYYIVGSTFVASMMDVVGKKKLIATLELTSGIAGCALYWATDITLATICTTIYFVHASTCFIPINSMISDLYPTHLRSAAMSIAMAFGRFGSGVLGAILGIMFEYDCTLTVFGLGAISIITVFLIIMLPRPTKVIELIA